MILSDAQAREIIDAALSFATADEVRVNLGGGRQSNTRFALSDCAHILHIQRFGNRIINCQTRIHRLIWILENHLNPTAEDFHFFTTHVGNIDRTITGVEGNTALCWLNQPRQ